MRPATEGTVISNMALDRTTAASLFPILFWSLNAVIGICYTLYYCYEESVIKGQNRTRTDIAMQPLERTRRKRDRRDRTRFFDKPLPVPHADVEAAQIEKVISSKEITYAAYDTSYVTRPLPTQ